MNPTYGVRRFTTFARRGDHHCHEVYDMATGVCASFPGTKKDMTATARAMNARRATVTGHTGLYAGITAGDGKAYHLTPTECVGGMPPVGTTGTLVYMSTQTAGARRFIPDTKG